MFKQNINVRLIRDLRERYQPDASISPQRDGQAGVTNINVTMFFNQLMDTVSD
jgi:hypothetical protein